MPISIPLANLLGSTIDNGRLHLIESLGRGSSGVVFRAIDTQTQTEYAVKCVYKAQKGTRQYIFQHREFQFQRSISGHSGIVTLHRVVEEDPYVFMVMDLCKGGDLFKFLTDKGTFRRNAKRVKSVILQLIDALEVCHRNGIYHRDVKPENIMCNEDGTRVRLGDFGLATDNKWSKNFGAGTSGYMSPECIGTVSGTEAYSSASNDVWALGVILTSMISGHNPWKKAVMTDDCFRAYVYNPGFFRNMLPISPAADVILRSIFTNYENRISLRKLRRMILEVDTFFMTDEEIAKSSIYVQMAAASYLADAPLRKELSQLGRSTPEMAQRSLVNEEKNPLGEVARTCCEKHPQDIIAGQPELAAHSHLSTLISSDVSDMVNASASPFKRPAPSPLPMPSYQDLMNPEGEGVEAPEASKCKKGRTCGPESAVTFLRRWMERIFV